MMGGHNWLSSHWGDHSMRVWDVVPVRCGCGMNGLRMKDVGCVGCGMQDAWDVDADARMPGCGMPWRVGLAG